MTAIRFSKKITACLLALLLSAAVAVPVAPANAGEPNLLEVFPKIKNAKIPKKGEWLEYVIAFPLDPLENAMHSLLAADPQTADQTAEQAQTKAAPVAASPTVPSPSFDPPIVWKAMPLRLEITAVSPQALEADMVYEGLRQAVSLPLGPPPEDYSVPQNHRLEQIKGDGKTDKEALSAMFAADAPPAQATDQPETAAGKSKNLSKQWIGNTEVEVTVESDANPYYGYTRLTNPELPFGIARIASDYVDVILVDHGLGIPPEFPSQDAHVEPPPG